MSPISIDLIRRPPGCEQALFQYPERARHGAYKNRCPRQTAPTWPPARAHFEVAHQHTSGWTRRCAVWPGDQPAIDISGHQLVGSRQCVQVLPERAIRPSAPACTGMQQPVSTLSLSGPATIRQPHARLALRFSGGALCSKPGAVSNAVARLLRRRNSKGRIQYKETTAATANTKPHSAIKPG